MLPLQFFGQNIHFGINIFAALVFFAVFWLYFDAWTNRRQGKVLVSAAGFLLLSVSFLVSATVIEQSVLGKSFLGDLTTVIAFVLRIAGYIVVIAAQIIDPLQERPELTGIDQHIFAHDKPAAKRASSKSSAGIIGAGSVSNGLQLLTPIGAIAVAALYWRRATTGLERHLKPVGIAFSLLAAYEILAVGELLRESNNPHIAQFTAAFGPLWIVEQAVLLGAVVVLGRWVWQYLTKRFMSQLFMIFTSLTIIVFLFTTVSFTFLLVNSVQKSSLDNLQTAAGVLSYALDSKKAETLAESQAEAANAAVIDAASRGDHTALTQAVNGFLKEKQQSSLLITDDAGKVLVRAEEPDRWGDSVSSDTLLRRALIGEPASTVTTVESVLAPKIYIRSAAPIRDVNKNIIGAVSVGLIADNNFVDGIKKTTGLDSAMYAGNIRSATTFIAPDGTSRWIGVKENSVAVQQQTLKEGKTFTGSTTVLSRHYLAVYAPLKDVDGSVIGMLFIGQPQVSILQAAGRSVQLTFVVTALLLALAILPAYYVSRYLSYQLD